MERRGIIYCAYNTINQKRYIGQTIQRLCERKGAHYSKISAPYFHNALMKYEKSIWDWKIIDYGNNQKELNDKETFWIKFFDTTNPKKGYNIREGGQDGVQTKEQILYARTCFIEENGKDRKQVKRKSARSILCIETGKVYSSCAEASRDIGVSASHSTEVLKGVHNTCGGYHWEYSDDLSCFKNAFRCKELQTVYLSFKQALDEDGFNTNKLSARLKEKSPCIYAGYTFEWINPQFHK